MPRTPFSLTLRMNDQDAGEGGIPCRITFGGIQSDFRVSSILASVVGASASLDATLDGQSVGVACDLKEQAIFIPMGTGNTGANEAPGLPVKAGVQCVVTLSTIDDFPPPGNYRLALTVFGIAENFGDKQAVLQSVAFSVNNSPVPGSPPKTGRNFG